MSEDFKFELSGDQEIVTGPLDLYKFARFEGIEIAGTRKGPDSDFRGWLPTIDLRAEVVKNGANALDAHLGPEIETADFSKLNEQRMGQLVREALADIKFHDDGRPYGSEVASLTSNFADKDNGGKQPT